MVVRLLAAAHNDRRLVAGAPVQAEFYEVQSQAMVGFAFDGED
jgi:hypothetical protein